MRLIIPAALLALATTSCLDDRRGELKTPARASFPLVGDMLHNHCGTLDCHGSSSRSLQIFGTNGLRLGDAIPGQGATTEEEYDASYGSIVTLEPEIMRDVVRDGGDNPERLTLIQKGRGAQVHVGEVALVRGSDADRCLTSWLTNVLDEQACADGAELEAPPPPE